MDTSAIQKQTHQISSPALIDRLERKKQQFKNSFNALLDDLFQFLKAETCNFNNSDESLQTTSTTKPANELMKSLTSSSILSEIETTTLRKNLQSFNAHENALQPKNDYIQRDSISQTSFPWKQQQSQQKTYSRSTTSFSANQKNGYQTKPKLPVEIIDLIDDDDAINKDQTTNNQVVQSLSINEQHQPPQKIELPPQEPMQQKLAAKISTIKPIVTIPSQPSIKRKKLDNENIFFIRDLSNSKTLSLNVSVPINAAASVFSSSSTTGKSLNSSTLIPHYDVEEGLVWMKASELNCYKMDCEYVGPDIIALNAHLRQVHQESPFRCRVMGCPDTFDDRKALREHIKKWHENHDDFCCFYCASKFSTYNKLATHQFDCHDEGRFLCTMDICSFIANTREVVHRHIKLAHSQGCRLHLDN